MYIITTESGGCVVDAVSRIGAKDDRPLIAVAIAKTNHTNQLLQQNQKFALSVLGEKVDPDLIHTFGFKSSRDIDKLAKTQTHEVEGVQIIERSLGYMVLEKIDTIDNDTHSVFIGKLIEGDILDDEDTPMTYAYYQDHKDDLKKVKTEQAQTAWVCTACGYIYYGDEVPEDFRCPLCGLGKEFFKKQS